MVFDGVQTDTPSIRNLLVSQPMTHGVNRAPFGRRQQVIMWRSPASFRHDEILAGELPIYPPLFKVHESGREHVFMSPLAGLLIAALLIAGLVMFLRGGADGGEDLEKELYRLCRGDREMMNRLISYELDRGPGRSRKAAIKAAINSYKRDNR